MAGGNRFTNGCADEEPPSSSPLPGEVLSHVDADDVITWLKLVKDPAQRLSGGSIPSPSSPHSFSIFRAPIHDLYRHGLGGR